MLQGRVWAHCMFEGAAPAAQRKRYSSATVCVVRSLQRRMCNPEIDVCENCLLQRTRPLSLLCLTGDGKSYVQREFAIFLAESARFSACLRFTICSSPVLTCVQIWHSVYSSTPKREFCSRLLFFPRRFCCLLHVFFPSAFRSSLN